MVSRPSLMCVVNLDGYDRKLEELSLAGVTKHLKRLRGENQALFWRCPEGEFDIAVIIERGFSETDTSSMVACGQMKITGELVIASYDNLLFAQDRQVTFPSRERYLEDTEIVFRMNPGRYKLRVFQQFSWDGKSQFPKQGHQSLRYCIVLER